MLLRGAVAEAGADELDAAGDFIRPVACRGDRGRRVAVAMLDAFDRIAQCARRAMPDRRSDLRGIRSVRIDPRAALLAKHRGEVVGAIPVVRADAAVVVDRVRFPGVRAALVVGAVGEALVAEADARVRAVAERLALRAAATAQRDLVHGRALAAVGLAQIWDGIRRLSINQVVRSVGRAGDLRLGIHGAMLNRGQTTVSHQAEKRGLSPVQAKRASRRRPASASRPSAAAMSDIPASSSAGGRSPSWIAEAATAMTGMPSELRPAMPADVCEST